MNELLAGTTATEMKMIKHFCDVCENELTEENRIKGEQGRLRSERERPGQRIMVEVTTGLSGNWNAGDF